MERIFFSSFHFENKIETSSIKSKFREYSRKATLQIKQRVDLRETLVE